LFDAALSELSLEFHEGSDVAHRVGRVVEVSHEDVDECDPVCQAKRRISHSARVSGGELSVDVFDEALVLVGAFGLRAVAITLFIATPQSFAGIKAGAGVAALPNQVNGLQRC